ncbi:UDP-N-acetylmuramate--L-alanine ligase [Alphaproteobacteria bacterium]|nr:UDP-N-acetylmuramate--L-alanine ligase [Alphaproteobacteria bacterium]
MDINFLRSKSVHVIGINGIGMSALAIFLHNKNIKVTGSDISVNSNTKILNKYGIKVTIGHKKENILNKDVIFYSSAIKNNPEVLLARKLKIPLYNRAKLLQIICKNKFLIAVSGSHGKTTTTSLLGHILDKKGLNPIIISGGIMKNYGQNIHLTDSEFVVVEADESDGTVFKLRPNFLIYLNVDSEHLDYYKTLSNLENKVSSYIEKLNKNNTKFFLNGDDNFLSKINFKNVIKFGFHSTNKLIIKNLQISDKRLKFDLISKAYENIVNVNSNLLGNHNAYNVAAVCCVLNELGIKLKPRDLMSFKGIERRMNIIGSIRSSLFIDDYAHHPVEIDKLISVLKLFPQKNKFLIIEPHRFSRLNSLYQEYITVLLNVPNLIILETYSAGEYLKKNWKNSKNLVNDINAAKTKKAIYINSYEELFGFFDENIIKSKDNLFICAGAGSISKELKNYYESRKKRIRKT